MKTYFNGQRKGMMYGGNIRKPMMYGGKVQKMAMGGMAEKNVKPNAQMGMMGMKHGGKVKKMAMGGKLVGGQKKLDMNKNGRIDGQDFKMMKK
tara:strand:- start:244 stop:522 length:279 start_codon:yes stop_codon:yes gene_type:complete